MVGLTAPHPACDPARSPAWPASGDFPANCDKNALPYFTAAPHGFATSARTIMPRPHEPVARPLEEGAEPGRIDERSFFEAVRAGRGRAAGANAALATRPPRPTGRCSDPRRSRTRTRARCTPRCAGTDGDPRCDREGLRRPAEDAAPRRQRRRRGRRLRRDGRHPAPDLAGGGPPGRPRAAPGARPRVRRRAHLRLARRRLRAGQAAARARSSTATACACWPSARTASTARRSGRPRARRSRTSGRSACWCRTPRPATASCSTSRSRSSGRSTRTSPPFRRRPASTR